MRRSARRLGVAWAAALLAGACGLAPPASPAAASGRTGGGGGGEGSGAGPGVVPTTDPGGSSGSPVAPFPGYRLAWNDEFDGSAVDPARWRVQSGARRDGVATPDAVTVADGALHVAVYTEDGVTKMGFLSTESKFAQRYGYFEARIRFQSAPGEWCAFWLQSPTIGQPLGDPAAAGTEIDVVEHRFTDDRGWALQDWVAQNLNWDGYGADVKREQHVAQLPGNARVQGEWHTFGVLWRADAYTFYVDGQPIWTTAQAVSRRTEFLQLTCEVQNGGDWAGFVPAGGYGPRGTSRVGMDVDWVRAWEPPPDPDPDPVPTLPAGYQLAWRDEFEGTALDGAKWTANDAPRGDAVDTPDAVALKDGVMSIRTYTEGGVTKTGFLSTEGGRFDATFGYFEARIRFHESPGEWCAFWLMSPTVGNPLGDPATAGTEIDVAEHRYTDQGGGYLGDQIGQNVLWDGYGPHRAIVNHVDVLPDHTAVQDTWHTFGLLWEPDGYTFYVDANVVWQTSRSVSRRSEYVLLTCEVLEHEWAGDVPAGGYGPRSTSATGMDVDWVRVWQKR